MDRRCLFDGNLLFMMGSNKSRAQDITHKVYKFTGVQPSEYYIIHNGKKLENDETITSDIHCVLRTFGGKGGFGSMLRAIGAQIEKTTNREACRDLSGRRLRDINEEKRLKAWLDKQKERENEAEEKRRRKLEKLVAIPKHEFKDSEYENARSELTEKISEAVEEGFKKAALKSVESSSVKRKATFNTVKSKAKKAALWIGDDVSVSSCDDSESDSEFEEECSVKKTSTSNPKIVLDSGSVNIENAENDTSKPMATELHGTVLSIGSSESIGNDTNSISKQGTSKDIIM